MLLGLTPLWLLDGSLRAHRGGGDGIDANMLQPATVLKLPKVEPSGRPSTHTLLCWVTPMVPEPRAEGVADGVVAHHRAAPDTAHGGACRPARSPAWTMESVDALQRAGIENSAKSLGW